MDKLDTLVTENLIEKLFQPERLNVILGKLTDRRSDKASEIERRVCALQAEFATAEDKLRRLYTMVENGLTELDDILKDRIATLKSDRDRAKDALARITIHPKLDAFDAQAIERFGQIMRQNITTGPIQFRKAYIRSVVDRIEVNDHAIRIIGDQAALEQVIAGDQTSGPDVRSFVRKWRTRRDSNA